MSIERQPPYLRAWNWFKSYPEIFAKGCDRSPETSGEAAAALISAGTGCLTLTIAHHLANFLPEHAEALSVLGRWMPGSNNEGEWGALGTYAGEQTSLYFSWLLSWGLLHLLLRNRRVTYKSLFWGLFGSFVPATLMCWHPIFPYLHLR